MTAGIFNRLRKDALLKAVFLAAFAYMVFLALSYGLCWQDYDVPHKFHPRILDNGPALRLEDFTRIFNIGPGGYKLGKDRLRYLQDLLSLLDIKFRIWLFNHVPPHPSVTLVWIFVLFLTPWMMFKLIYQLTRNRSTSWIGTILLTLTAGHLFGITKMSNPAKPLANFLCLAIFYLAARADNDKAVRGVLSRRGRCLFVLMLLLMLLSFFTDETTWMFYFMVPVLFPKLFLPLRRDKFAVRGYLVMTLAAVVLVVGVFPVLLRTFTPGETEVRPTHHLPFNSDPDAVPIIGDFFGPRLILLTARNLAWSQLVPRGWFKTGVVYLAVLTAYLVFQFYALSPPLRALCSRLLLVMCFFVAVQSLAIAHVYDGEGYILQDSMYYGALFSVFLTIPLAVLLSAEPLRLSRLINRALLIFVAGVMVYNFGKINEAKRFQNALYENAGEMGYATSLEIWRHRKDPAAIDRYKHQYPIWSPWAYIQEIEWVAGQYPRQ